MSDQEQKIKIGHRTIDIHCLRVMQKCRELSRIGRVTGPLWCRAIADNKALFHYAVAVERRDERQGQHEQYENVTLAGQGEMLLDEYIRMQEQAGQVADYKYVSIVSKHKQLKADRKRSDDLHEEIKQISESIREVSAKLHEELVEACKRARGGEGRMGKVMVVKLGEGHVIVEIPGRCPEVQEVTEL